MVRRVTRDALIQEFEVFRSAINARHGSTSGLASDNTATLISFTTNSNTGTEIQLHGALGGGTRRAQFDLIIDGATELTWRNELAHPTDGLVFPEVWSVGPSTTVEIDVTNTSDQGSGDFEATLWTEDIS